MLGRAYVIDGYFVSLCWVVTFSIIFAFCLIVSFLWSSVRVVLGKAWVDMRFGDNGKPQSFKTVRSQSIRVGYFAKL